MLERGGGKKIKVPKKIPCVSLTSTIKMGLKETGGRGRLQTGLGSERLTKMGTGRKIKEGLN